MKKIEKEEINNIPKQYRPMGAWSYFLYQILFVIPLIGLICLIVFSLDSSNIVRRSFARSYFCVLILAVIVIILIFALGVGLEFLNEFKAALNQ